MDVVFMSAGYYVFLFVISLHFVIAFIVMFVLRIVSMLFYVSGSWF
jgi:hypothetical protein